MPAAQGLRATTPRSLHLGRSGEVPALINSKLVPTRHVMGTKKQAKRN